MDKYSFNRRSTFWGAILAAGIFGASPAAAADPVISAVFTGSITVSGGTVGTDGYVVTASTASNFTGTLYSSSTQNQADALSPQNLDPNTTYYLEAGPLNGTTTSYTAGPFSTSTLAAVPSLTTGQATVLKLGPHLMQVQWSGNGNPPGTIFDCQISSVVSDFSIPPAIAITTSATSATFGNGLLANTPYHLRVRAINNNGVFTDFSLGSGSTTTPVYMILSFPSESLTATSIEADWSAPDDSLTAWAYRVVASTKSSLSFTDLSGEFYADTFVKNATFSPLIPNTLYHFAYRACDGGTCYQSTPLVSATTLPKSPVGPGQILQVTGSTIAVSWDPNGNPEGTSYLAQISVSSPSFNPIFLSISVVSTSAVFSGLTSATTYYMRVKTQSIAGNTDFVSLLSTATLAAAPGIASFTVVGSSSLQANWTDSGNSAGTLYTAFLSTGPSPEINRGFTSYQSSTTANSFAVFSGLAPDTTYYVDVQVSGPATYSEFAVLGATPTWANAPGPGAVTIVVSSQVTANWGDNGNPSGTLYLLEASTDPLFGLVAASSSTVATTATVSGLLPFTTYYLQVQAVNFVVIATSWTQLGSTTTFPIPQAVQNLQAAMVGVTSITWSWGSVAGSTSYNFNPSSGGPPISLSTTNLTLTGLFPNSVYGGSVSAVNVMGSSECAPVTVYTLAATPTVSSFTVLGISSVTLLWADSGNPAGTRYVPEIWYSTDPWHPVVAKIPALPQAATNYTFTDLVPGTTYWLDVYALNESTVASPPSVATSTFLDYFTSVTTATNSDAGFCLFLNTPHGPISACFPSGTFSVPVVTVTLQGLIAPSTSMPFALSPAAQLAAVGVGVKLDVDPALQPLHPVTLTLGYIQSDADAVGQPRDTFVLAYYDPAQNVWVPLPSTSLTASYLVTGQTRHLSVFQIMSAMPASNLSTSKVYPNPFRPALGHSAITFSRMPANSSIRIYTVLGELVKDFDTDATGTANWDATNKSGQSVASGSYFALVQADGKKSILKVLIQR